MERSPNSRGPEPLPSRTRCSLIATLTLGAAFVSAAARPASAQLANSAWPMFHHDVRHTGQSEYDGPATATVKWMYRNIARFQSSPAIGPDGTIFYGTVRLLCANDPTNGSKKWCTHLVSTIKRSSPAVAADGTVYVGARDDRLYALCSGSACGALTQGSIKWSFQIHDDGDVRVSPAIGPDGTVYMAGTFNGSLHALNPNGSLKWKFSVGEAVINASPALADDGSVYLGFLHKVSSTGSRLWEFHSGSRNRSSSPAIATDGTVYVGTTRGLFAINPDGTQRWLVETPGRVVTTPAIATDGTIYVGTALRFPTLYAINPDGTVKWTFAGTKSFNSSPIVGANGVIYAASGKTVHAVNPDGTLLWEHVTLGNIVASPAIAADGTLYMAGGRYLYAFGD
jgi:outer membrane protein assembly factor BamB